MTTRRDFLAIAAASAQPLNFPDIGPILGAPARHKQAFGIRTVSDGEGLTQMRNAFDAYEIARGEGPGTLRTAGVLYGGTSIALAFDDATWRAYRIAEALKLRADAVALDTTHGNPFARGTDASIATLAARGAAFFACNNAVEGFAKSLTAELGLVHDPIARVADRLRAALLPGVTLVPAGVAAINDVQERHYTYIAV
jgi:intracellular sulfur oxidation DsrE/DsrF family protein